MAVIFKASKTISLRSELIFTQKSVGWGTNFQKWAGFASEVALKVSSLLNETISTTDFSLCYRACNWLMLSLAASLSPNWLPQISLILICQKWAPLWNSSSACKLQVKGNTKSELSFKVSSHVSSIHLRAISLENAQDNDPWYELENY